MSNETPTPSAAPLTLWLTDRSRVERGLEQCQRARYLGSHAGPTGYGWQRKATSIPQVTGTLVHQPISEILLYAKEHGNQLPPDEVIFTAITNALTSYQDIIDTRGLALTVDEATYTQKVEEQRLLLEGLVWTFARVTLPRLLAEWKIILVEQEEVSIIGCTCGLGDGIVEPEDHDARGCDGIGWMTRADAVAQKIAPPHTYAYWEFKTTSRGDKGWEEQWPYRIQVLAGVLGAEHRLGVRIDEIWIPGLIKGKYEAEYDYETKSKTGPKFQNSPLVYGWRRRANPPISEEEWAVSHSYVDDQGKHRKLTRDFSRTKISEIPPALWKDSAGCLSPGDFWTRVLHAQGKLAESIKVLGPIYRNDQSLERFTRQLISGEKRWQAILWQLYDHTQATGEGWGAPGFMAKLDELIPQTFGSACKRYFGDTCEFEGLCYEKAGWEDPALVGMIPRRPHHTPELHQAISRGLLIPDAGLVDEGED